VCFLAGAVARGGGGREYEDGLILELLSHQMPTVPPLQGLDSYIGRVARVTSKTFQDGSEWGSWHVEVRGETCTVASRMFGKQAERRRVDVAASTKPISR
jgi:hypothetical protein